MSQRQPDDREMESLLASNRPRPDEAFRAGLGEELRSLMASADRSEATPATTSTSDQDDRAGSGRQATGTLAPAQAKLAVAICGILGTSLMMAGAIAA